MRADRSQMRRPLSLTSGGIFAGTIMGGLALSLVVRGTSAAGWLYTLCLLSAIIVATGQQTLP